MLLFVLKKINTCIEVGYFGVFIVLFNVDMISCAARFAAPGAPNR